MPVRWAREVVSPRILAPVELREDSLAEFGVVKATQYWGFVEDLRGILNCRGAVTVRTARRCSFDLAFLRSIVPKTLASMF